MKILLIGHSIIDHIENYNAQEIKPGGIFYSVLGVLSLINENDSVQLLTSISKPYQKLFSLTYDFVDLSLTSVDESMPEVVLKLSQGGERKEIYKYISANLDFSRLDNLQDFDGILINMISGYDISIEQLKWLRGKFNCPIYFDVHTLSRGLDKDMNRFFRPIPDVEKWLHNIDILQCNENELASVCPILPIEKAIDFIFSHGVQILLITRAENGAEAYFTDRKVRKKYSVAAEKVDTKNKVGCGDIFGAVFFYSYISTQDVYASLALANSAGAIAASTENLATHLKIDLK